MRLPYDDSHKQSVTMMYLDLLQLKKFRVLTGINTFQMNTTKTMSGFPEWSDDDESDSDNDSSSDNDEMVEMRKNKRVRGTMDHSDSAMQF